ncbi:MAG: ATP-binding protein [Candidatus Marinimicrobia bacterium]|nr:ATP-binding protein [Candidatus Neomarinimicrobiota bacterium]
MLIEFTVGNFRSFKDKQTFSLEAVGNLASPESISLLEDANQTLLPSAVIYGANASGKTNLILALNFMRNFVINSSAKGRRDGPIPYTPFRLNPANSEIPSYFEIVFITDGVRYRYGFEMDSSQVISEWLYRRKIREVSLFKREKGKMRVNAGFKEGLGLERRTRSNALYLSVVAQFNGEIAGIVTKWYRRNLKIFSALIRPHYTNTTIDIMKKHDDIAQFIKNVIYNFDTGIDDIIIKDSLRGARFEEEESQEPEIMEPGPSWSDQYEVVTKHYLYNDENEIVGSVNFDMIADESDGTERLFDLIGPILYALVVGATLVVDEFENRLHPLLLYSLIRLFNSDVTNNKNAQIIITTHNHSLLDQNLFRKDQIWLTEKRSNGASNLFSLSEYKFPTGSKVRSDSNFGVDYLKGKYGAIPFIDNIEDIFLRK